MIRLRTIVFVVSLMFFSQAAMSQEGWSDFYVQYNGSKFFDKTDDVSFNGISAGLCRARNIAQGSELFLESGICARYSFSDDFGSDYGLDDVEMHYLTALVPVNIAYKLKLDNSNVDIVPFAGVNTKFHITGDLRGDKSLDPFSKREMDGFNWSRWQIGWQVGVKLRFSNSVSLGISYEKDFTEIWKKVNSSSTIITLSFNMASSSSSGNDSKTATSL